MFAFADGHVQFIAESVDLATYRALSTREGGEARDDVEISLSWAGGSPFVESFGDEGSQPPPE